MINQIEYDYSEEVLKDINENWKPMTIIPKWSDDYDKMGDDYTDDIISEREWDDFYYRVKPALKLKYPCSVRVFNSCGPLNFHLVVSSNVNRMTIDVSFSGFMPQNSNSLINIDCTQSNIDGWRVSYRAHGLFKLDYPAQSIYDYWSGAGPKLQAVINDLMNPEFSKDEMFLLKLIRARKNFSHETLDLISTLDPIAVDVLFNYSIKDHYYIRNAKLPWEKREEGSEAGDI